MANTLDWPDKLTGKQYLLSQQSFLNIIEGFFCQEINRQDFPQKVFLLLRL